MATQSERRATTRQSILDAAEALFTESGYDSTSVDEITATARVAKGTFYQHFETKLDVLLALTRRQQDGLAGVVLKALEADTPPLDVGRTLVHWMAEWCKARGPVAGELVLRALERPEKQQASSSRAMLSRIFQAGQKCGAVRNDVSADILAMVTIGAMVPTMVYWSKFPDEGDLEVWLEQTWRLMIEGVLPRKEDLV